MEDPDLSQRRRSDASERIQDKWSHDRYCPICGNGSWTIGDIVALMPWRMKDDPNTFVHGPAPLVPFFCDNCGYALLFNALIVGALNADGSSPVPPDATGEPE